MPAIHQLQERWPSLIQAHPPIQNGRLPWHHICIGNNSSPLPRQNLRLLKHIKQLHSLCFSQARTKLIKPTNGLPHSSFNSRTRSEEVSWWNQSISEASSTCIFGFCLPRNPTPTLCSGIIHLFGNKRVCTDKLNHLLLLIGHNKRRFYNQSTRWGFCSSRGWNMEGNF